MSLGGSLGAAGAGAAPVFGGTVPRGVGAALIEGDSDGEAVDDTPAARDTAGDAADGGLTGGSATAGTETTVAAGRTG
jgi:hypothetical protein